MKLVEKYRPQEWGDVIGQDKALDQIDRLRARGLGARAIWLSGPSGTGKTTIARLIAQEVATPWHTHELDATELKADRLSEILEDIAHYGMGKRNGKAVVVNEAHGLRADIIRRLLVALEDIPRHAIWVFTTTADAQSELFDAKLDASPLLSRCAEISMAKRGLAEPFARRAKEIAQAEDLDGAPESRYLRLMKDVRNNFRRALQKIECGEMLD